jgi:hypothetical protein
MKTMYYKLLLLPSLALTLALASCDFLDVVPDEKPTEADAFADFQAARRYLYSCYSYLPNPKNGANSLDLMTGDEVVTAFEHENFAKFSVGQFTATSPVISYWNTFFQGLRQCYTLLEKIDNVPGMSTADREDYKAQIHFLIAYFHFLQIRCYGSCILVKELPRVDASVSDYLGRSTLDECVQFVCDEFDRAAAVLPPRRTIVLEEGLATGVAAKALKGKMLLYAASPLFNGGGEDGGGIRGYLSNFKSKNGAQLLPLTYDPAKWDVAKAALLEAVTFAEGAGYSLRQYSTYGVEQNPHPSDPVVRAMRNNVLVPGNSEFIWSDSRQDDRYGLAVKSLPHVEGAAWNGVGLTLAMLKRFYTKNGLPVDKDPEFYEEDQWWHIESEVEWDSTISGMRTMYFNKMREPRYYAWVAFQHAFYELISSSANGAYDADASYVKWGPGRLMCNFVLGGNTSRQPGEAASYRVNNFSPSGTLNKKFVPVTMLVGKDQVNLTSAWEATWPIIRLADLYLMYAEACVETGDLNVAKEYLDKVRVRAGIPTVDEAWNKPGVGGAGTKEILRSIVRQERQVELYLENQNFWDMRRWLLAADAFEGFAQGMNADGTVFDVTNTSTTRYNQVIDAKGSGGIHHFANPTHYFLPIPIGDINRNPNITQNPGY